MKTNYDVVIVGGGMVGACLACALAQTDLQVAVLEFSEPQLSWPEDSVDLRVSAISVASQRIFKAVDAWQYMLDGRVSPYRDMKVWDSTGNGRIHFDSADVGMAEMGHIIENRVIRAALLKRIEEHDNIHFICPTSLASWYNDDDALYLTLADGSKIKTALLVGADGSRSQVREQAGISYYGWPYDQSGVVAVVETELPHQETAWQRFLTTGPLAFLPLADGRSSIVWSTTPDAAENLVAMNDEQFCIALGEALEGRLGAIMTTTQRAAFPLKLQHAEQYVQERIALVGDAAHMIHPLAGQGANLGFLDAASLVDVISDAAQQGRNIGSLKVLRRYERWRKGGNVSMMYAMDGFKRLFSNDITVVKYLRNTGLTLADKCAPIKHRLMRQAMGEEGDLPRLAR
ncbi:2-polyprenylphenol hydroxylase [hydrothermal vent metagenome]|uniref:2-polyprenylphenol hydroxylase n=1 Tax=hydrothermal vent metagenome TaxID=652676 RepID=A0A3B0YU14_9ZZZZ